MKRSVIGIVAGVAAVVLVWWMAPAYFVKSVDPRSVQYLNGIAAEINRSVPVMIDAETELMPTSVGYAMLIYNYRLVKYSLTQLDQEKFAADAKQRVTQGACNRPETRDDFLKKGVTLRYSYFDKDKKHIATIDVTPADCGL